ncbi:MAG: hypothetical protein AB7I18_05880 [Candidatus Berkiella sp.]
MAVLRNTWQRCYRAALALLQNTRHPIAQYTFDIINKKELMIIPFAKLHKDDFELFLDNYYDEKNEQLPKIFPPSKVVIDKLTRIWAAKISENRVTINSQINNPKKIAEILIHEANHFLNDSNQHYETKEQMFLEEFRAEVAEALVFSKPVRNGQLRKIANHVADRFGMAHPKRVEMPSGRFFPEVR